MPAVPKRDKLAFELAEKASKPHRDKKLSSFYAFIFNTCLLLFDMYFQMPAVPKRVKLAFELAEKASKQHRDKKSLNLYPIIIYLHH